MGSGDGGSGFGDDGGHFGIGDSSEGGGDKCCRGGASSGGGDSSIGGVGGGCCKITAFDEKAIGVAASLNVIDGTMGVTGTATAGWTVGAVGVGAEPCVATVAAAVTVRWDA